MVAVSADEWLAELRSVVRPMLDDLLARDGLVLTGAEFDVIARFEPQPSDGNPLTWLAEVKERAHGLAQSRRRERVEVGDQGGHPVDDPGRVDDPRWAAFAEILALEAGDDPFVGNWRAHHLPTQGLLSRDEAPAFRDQLDREARRWLDQVATGLVDRHGWWDADEAALFVLTGAAPHGRRIRTEITVRDRVGASRVVIEADPRASPQAVADSYRKARSAQTLDELQLPEQVARSHRLDGTRPRPITPKAAALAIHLARQRDGSWADRRARWNISIQTANPDWTYEADAGFARDACRAWEHVVGEPFIHKRSPFRHF